jgi:hypothetical protein
MTREALRLASSLRNYTRLPLVAKIEHLTDRFGLPKADPGIDAAIEEGVGWLCRAQDNSISQDGGVARHFSLIHSWSSSYPETTGYIIPTMLSYAKAYRDPTARQRARRMLDWLVAIQLPCGGFQGGLIDSQPVVPVTFNTGQILLGLASGVREFGDTYVEAMRRAADWLVETQDPDGCWRNHPTPFATPGEKAYETHVAWGLLEAERIQHGMGYAEVALRNVKWALTLQDDRGWFDKCCLGDPLQPLTHTIGYALRGVIEAYRFTKDSEILDACAKTANGLLKAIHLQDGFLPGRITPNWDGGVSWACLTGSVQIAHCWLMLFLYTGNERYRDAAFAANRYVRRTVRVNGRPETRGAVKGSYPVSGEYGAYEFLNWACKFLIDSNMLEKEIRNQY